MNQSLNHSANQCELILGGQRSGKSRRAELLARDWLQANPKHQAVLLATAQPWDDEMRARIAKHQVDRAERVPGMQTVEEPLALGECLAQHSSPEKLVVVDCLTLWLTNVLMPADGKSGADVDARAPVLSLLGAITQAPGPVILVGNEIGMGVIPMGSEVRAFVDMLGWLNQEVARVCSRVTLMAAGLPLTLKAPA